MGFDSVASEKLSAWHSDYPRLRELMATAASPAAAAAQFGIELFQKGESRQAALLFEEAASLEPDQPLYWGNYGVALNACGDKIHAIAMLEKSLALNRDQPQIWLNLANTLPFGERREEAINAFRMAASHPGYAAEALTGLATLEFEALNYAEAVEAYRGAIKAGASAAAVYGSLGAALFQLGKVDEALDAYQAALRIDPSQAGLAGNVAFLAMLQGVIKDNAEAAIRIYASPLSSDQILIDAFNRALLFLTTFHHQDAARALAEEWQQYYPDDVEAAYFRLVLSGRRLERASKTYIAHHFDQFADKLDEKLVRHLDYKVPQKLADLVSAHLPKNWRGDILDAGCGTGLLGQQLAPLSNSLWGVDLSPRMIGRATERTIYDHLTVADLAEFMHGHPTTFDVVAAADVLIYFGRLEPVFTAAAAALQTEGWFVFSVETDESVQKFQLMPNGRFKHAKTYVEQAAGDSFRLVDAVETPLRRQNREPVYGTLYLFQKQS